MLKRGEILSKIKSEAEKGFDILIVGGGATGVGCALDAASRGFKTLLIEQYDFGKGTSSKSTKLIHGGVRYLEQGNIRLVYDALKERGLLLKNAPHIVNNLELVIPTYTRFMAPYFYTGMKMYELLAGRNNIAPSRLLSKKNLIEKLPNIESQNLRNGVSFYDAQFDDTRLLISMLHTLFTYDGLAINYCTFIDFQKDHKGKIVGIVCKDERNNDQFEIRAKIVINATGAKSESLQLKDDNQIELNIRASRGSHIVVPSEFLGGNTGLLIPKTPDGRVLFALPWLNSVLIGTTDVSDTNPSIDPAPSNKEIEFILETAGRYLKHAPGPEDVNSIFAGIRPLIISNKRKRNGNTKDVSRDHRISVSESGLLSISGGKWTTYRKMAEDTINHAIRVFNLADAPCKTRKIRLHGFGLDESLLSRSHLRSYGKDALEIQNLCKNDPRLLNNIHPDLEYTIAEIIWICRHEMAVCLEDVLARRTRSLFLNAKASIEAAFNIVGILQNEMDETSQWAEEEVQRFQAVAVKYQLEKS